MDHQSEMDARMRAMLADAPPQNWDEARRRLAVVRHYLDGADRSAAEAEAHAARIGIGRSLFYRLASIYAARPKSEEATVPKRDRSQAVEIVAEAVDVAGTTASPAQIYRTVVDLCRMRGTLPPSRKLVRSLGLAILAGGSVADRLGLRADFAIDRAPMGLTVDTDGTVPLLAHLCCIVDLGRGVIVDHVLSVGEPSLEQLEELMRRAPIDARRVATSESDPALGVPTIRAILLGRGCVVVPGRWHLGAAIRGVIGVRLGRVALLSRPPRSKEELPSAGLDTAQAVIAELLAPFKTEDGRIEGS